MTRTRPHRERPCHCSAYPFPHRHNSNWRVACPACDAAPDDRDVESEWFNPFRRLDAANRRFTRGV